MDQQSSNIPHPDRSPATCSGPTGSEGPAQSRLDLGKTFWRGQLWFLEVSEEGHAQAERARPASGLNNDDTGLMLTFTQHEHDVGAIFS